MIKTLVLGGGCFWGLQDLIRTRDGVISSTVGYSGGKIENPTYENHQGHAEVVEIKYDSEITPFKKLLDFFFQIHLTMPILFQVSLTRVCVKMKMSGGKY